MKTFRFLFVYDMTIVLLKRNGKMLMKWLRAVLETMVVFMHSYIEEAEAENTASVKRFSMCVVNETAILRHSLTQRHTEHRFFILFYSLFYLGFIFKYIFCGLIFTNTSPYRILI